MWKVDDTVQIQRRERRKLLRNDQHQLYIMAGAIPECIYIKFYHRGNSHGKYADEFHNTMSNEKDSYIPSQLIMFTCTALCHAFLVWQKNNSVYPKCFKSKLIAD
jgi:hypothetical protein